jgi:hypothetical protein
VVESAEREIPARRGESREPAPFNEYVQIFTEAEKTLELRGRFFHKLELVGADLSSADCSGSVSAGPAEGRRLALAS